MVMLQPLEKGVSIPEAGHKFMVQSCFAPHSDVDLENIWKNIEPSKLMSSKLFVSYEPARDNTEDEPARKDTAAPIKYLWSPDIIPSTKTSDSGRSVSDLESELRSEVEQRKKVENEKNTLNKEIQELFKKNARLQEDFQRISMAEIGASPIQVIFATIAALLLGLIIGRLF